MQQRRVLLLDASCAIAGSHNPRACRLFARAFEARGFAARYMIPRHGEAAFPGEEAAVERVLPYPYARRYGLAAGAPQHPLDPRLHAIVERHRGERRQHLANLVRLPRADRQIAALFAGALAPELDRLGLAQRDVIVLPTADLYASGGLLSWLQRRPPAEAPAVLLRFLNILESEGLYRPYERLKALLRRIAVLQGRGYRIVIATEVEPWAARLQRRAGVPVLLLPTPPDRATPGPRGARPLGVSLVSLRRAEQGARRLVPILQALPDDVRGRLRFVGQAPRLGTGDLLVPEGVQVVADDLSELELAATLAGLDITLLPYRAEDYRTRGSSMLFEAANHGHVVLASAGCGFSAEVERFELGSLCSSDADFAAALTTLARESNSLAGSEAAAARYNDYRRTCFDRALQALGG
ncbi:MAG TPA: hypothetical protein VJL84_04290 [Kiloniellales bacterium]|nr:hypothetical protein [Kiloniellales bacterium]